MGWAAQRRRIERVLRAGGERHGADATGLRREGQKERIAHLAAGEGQLLVGRAKRQGILIGRALDSVEFIDDDLVISNLDQRED
jgi:hypothetical protein